MEILADIIILILSAGLIILIAVQQRGSAGGLGSAVFGFSGGLPFLQRRGLEKYMYYITWAVAVAILTLSLFRIWF